MPQTFCYLCIKKPLTLPHTPLRILKHRRKTHTSPQKHEPEERTKNTNPKHEPRKERSKARTQKHEPRKERPKARTTKRTTKSTNHEKHDRKARAPKARIQKHEPSPDVSSPPPSPVVCKPASQSHKAQQAPLIASLRPRTQSSPCRSHVS